MTSILDTCIVIATPQSSATEEIHLLPFRREVMVFWQSNHYSNHACRRRDMLALLMDLKQSAGAWVNRCCKQRHISIAV